MTQIDWAGLAPISRAIVGKAIFAIALSSTDMTIPTTSVRIAQYRCGSGTPSSAVFILPRRPPSVFAEIKDFPCRTGKYGKKWNYVAGTPSGGVAEVGGRQYRPPRPPVPPV